MANSSYFNDGPPVILRADVIGISEKAIQIRDIHKVSGDTTTLLSEFPRWVPKSQVAHMSPTEEELGEYFHRPPGSPVRLLTPFHRAIIHVTRWWYKQFLKEIEEVSKQREFTVDESVRITLQTRQQETQPPRRRVIEQRAIEQTTRERQAHVERETENIWQHLREQYPEIPDDNLELMQLCRDYATARIMLPPENSTREIGRLQRMMREYIESFHRQSRREYIESALSNDMSRAVRVSSSPSVERKSKKHAALPVCPPKRVKRKFRFDE